MPTRIALLLLGSLLLSVMAAFTHAYRSAPDAAATTLCALGGVCSMAFGVHFMDERNRYERDLQPPLFVGLPPLETMDALYAR